MVQSQQTYKSNVNTPRGSAMAGGLKKLRNAKPCKTCGAINSTCACPKPEKVAAQSA